MNSKTMIPAQRIYTDLIHMALHERDKAASLKGTGDTSTRIRALGAETAFNEAAKQVKALAEKA